MYSHCFILFINYFNIYINAGTNVAGMLIKYFSLIKPIEITNPRHFADNYCFKSARYGF